MSLTPTKIFIFFLLITIQVTSQGQALVDHWETVVYDSNTWKYFPGKSDPGTDWMLVAYDDSSWPEGKTSVGYGDGDDQTIIDTVKSVFLRRKFNIVNKNDIAALVLHVDFDDGFIAYLNGTEIARSNMGTGVPAYNQLTTTDHEALLYQGIVPDHFEIDTQLLESGENILSYEVHNVQITSSDLTAAAFMSVGVISSSENYGPVPSWFVPPVSIAFTSSNLPIVVINTHGQLIMDEPRINADMGIIYNGVGNRNFITDPFNNYNGKISVEIRGESSQMFPKKSWRVETRDASDNNLNVSLIGMPDDNDWILYAPYTDKTMIRDVLTYSLGSELGKVYAPRTRFVEVVLNDEYQGVYVLMEKIKRDKNRVAITKLNPGDVTDDALTGGYILRVDKLDANDYPAWTPIPVPTLPGEGNPQFQYYDPKGEDLVTTQQNYIKNYILQFESNLSGSGFDDPTLGYKKFIDVSSFLNFILINEVGKNIDAYVFSTYLYKERDSKGGKLFMGPLWDFNLAYGNVNYLANSQFAPGWTYNDNYRMFWFRRLMNAPSFADSMKCRWNELRLTTLSTAHIMNQIDSMATLLGESQIRNYQRWPILGTYIWPNQYIGNTFQDEINFLKTWISDRLTWMDSNMPGTCEPPPTVTGVELKYNPSAVVDIYPNPATGTVQIKFENPLNMTTQLLVYNEMGICISDTEIGAQEQPYWDGKNRNGTVAASGLYLLELRSAGKVIFKGKVIKV